jgi:hypothetical protein
MSTEKVHFNKNSVSPAENGHVHNENWKSEVIALLHKNPFSDTVRILYDTRAMHPRDLFKAPANLHYTRAPPPKIASDSTIDQQTAPLLVSGKVQLISKKGHQSVRWARLSEDYFLNFYEAELDTSPVDTRFLFGYSVLTNEPGEFVLIHQNQITTERKSLKITFRVDHSSAIEEWKEALLEKLGLPPLLDGPSSE